MSRPGETSRSWVIFAGAALVLLAPAACRRAEPSLAPANTAVTPATHSKFPIVTGVHAVDCQTCHGDFASFRQFTCFKCHGHEKALTDELHRSLVAAGGSLPDGRAGYVYSSDACLQCHARAERVAFDHAGTTSACASCHGGGAPFDPLPVAGVGLDGRAFVHPDQGGNDCRACHTIASWTTATGAPEGRRDPSQDAVVAAEIPSYAGPSIAALTPRTEALPMPMFHRSASVPQSLACIDCHASVNTGSLFPGRLHASLPVQPAACLDCHATSVPSGFVGPAATSPPRTPPSPEMKHDAVLWSNGVPTSTPAVPQECSRCHLPPPASPTWATSRKFHASLAAQPSSCIDCHANTRPNAVLAAPAYAVPSFCRFDHRAGPATGDCATCHSSGAAQLTSWSGGRFHLPGSATPTTCLPCHEGERPTSTTAPLAWINPAYANSPFDYGGYSDPAATPPVSFKHGDAQDCVACHANAGTGSWGGTGANWASGWFDHTAPGSDARTTCVTCHSTQRPAAPIPHNGATFDHSLNGTGDCFGCHQNTVTAIRSYVRYPADWSGGVGYPGSTLISAPSQFITVSETTLNPPPPGLVTGTSAIVATLHDSMLHDDPLVLDPLNLYPGPTSSPDYTKCAFCHTTTNTLGAPYANGQFHSRLAPAQQPASRCGDCHTPMRPAGIVSRNGDALQPMDHDAAFAAAATVLSNGVQVSVTNVDQIDCSTCHASTAGTTWSDGVFHKNVGAAVPADCTVCHFTLMIDASADVTSGVSYAMRHASAQLTFQNCQLCHASALSSAAATPLGAALWRPGSFHDGRTQPLACNDCHAVSAPGASTQSTVTYAFAAGGTPTNGAQWMNHGSISVVGKDCAACHAADAAATAAGWSKSDSYHANVTTPGNCLDCHGVYNGGGTVPGAGNNLPAGLTDSSTVTSAAADVTTGIPAGTHDQITHDDANVWNHDCNFCHAQEGVSNVAGVQGKEWAQATFHASFSGANPLDTGGSRCSNCHMNVKPSAGFPQFDHSGFSATPGTQDCSACHSWPGTGTATSPNWLGAAAVPQTVTLSGWSSGTSITSNTVTFAHPAAATYTSCAQCHAGSNFALIVDYNHDGLQSNVTINGLAVTTPNLGTSIYDASANPTFCVACHNTGSPWIDRAGMSSSIIAGTISGSTTVTTASTAALTLGMTVAGTGIPDTITTTTTFTADIASGSATVTNASPVTLRAGTLISGPGIPVNDTVAASVFSATSFTLTSAATATASGVTLTATTTLPLTVTIRSILDGTSFAVSTAANATVTGTTLAVTHMRALQAAIGTHQASTNGQDCTSCHYVGGPQYLLPPTPGVFGSGDMGGN